MKLKLVRQLAKLLTVALCLGLFSLPSDALAADAQPETLAENLHALGLFQGAGTADTVDFDLDRAPNRAEALTMLIRLLGEEEAALSGTWEHPFTDVPTWAESYVGYAYEHGLTKGVTATTFQSLEPVTSAMYLTYVLRALGYQDGTYENRDDFLWNQPEPLAIQCGVLPITVDVDEFTRGDAVEISYAALLAHEKGSTGTLAQKLIGKGAFTQTQYQEVVDEAAFADSQAIHDALLTAITTHEGTFFADEMMEGVDHRAVAYYPVLYQREGNQLTVYLEALNCLYRYDGERRPQNKVSMSVSLRVTLTREETGRYTVTDYWSSRNQDNLAETITALFPPEALDKLNHFQRESNYMACFAYGTEEYLLGKVTLPKPDTYEAALADLRSRSSYHITEETATPYGAIVRGYRDAGGHGGSFALFFVPTALCTEQKVGTVLELPTPMTTPFVVGEPDTMDLDLTANTLTYTYSNIYVGNWEMKTDTIYTYVLYLPTGIVTETTSPAPVS